MLCIISLYTDVFNLVLNWFGAFDEHCLFKKKSSFISVFLSVECILGFPPIKRHGYIYGGEKNKVIETPIPKVWLGYHCKILYEICLAEFNSQKSSAHFSVCKKQASRPYV